MGKKSGTTEPPRSIRLPNELWEALDKEAVRCKRSATKQLKAILALYFGDKAVEIDQSRIEFVRSRSRPVLSGMVAIPIIGTANENEMPDDGDDDDGEKKNSDLAGHGTGW